MPTFREDMQRDQEMMQRELAMTDADVDTLLVLKDQKVLTLILDITGSMGSQMNGVKKSVAKLLTTANEEVPVLMMTFCENSTDGCFVTHNVFTNFAETARFVETLSLCRPPGTTGIEAHGGDGPENIKAALAILTKLPPTSMPLIYFITDADPHYRDCPSAESEHEKAWLSRMAPAIPLESQGDVFALMDYVFNHFETEPQCIVVKYDGASEFASNLALRSSKLVVYPSAHDVDALASLLEEIYLQWTDEDRPLTLTSRIRVQVPGEEQKVESEQDMARVALDCTMHSGAAAESLYRECMTNIREMTGKYVKRSVKTSTLCMFRQIQLALTLMKMARGDSSLYDKAVGHFNEVLELIPRAQKGHIAMTMKFIDEMRNSPPLKDIVDEGALASIISMLSATETIDALDEEATEQMESVLMELLRFFSVRMLQVLFPQNPLTGESDFADSWGARIGLYSSAQMTAAEALRCEGKCPLRSTDQTLGEAVVAISDTDKTQQLIWRIATLLQLGDLVQAMCLKLPNGTLLPSLSMGITSSTLVHLSGQPRTEANLEFQRRLMSTIVHYAKSPGRDVQGQLENGHLNPADRMTKFLAVVVHGHHAWNSCTMRCFLIECIRGSVQQFFGKCSPESDQTYLDDLKNTFVLDPPLEGFETRHALEDEDASIMEAIKVDTPLYEHEAFKHADWLHNFLRTYAPEFAGTNLYEFAAAVFGSREKAHEVYMEAILLRFRKNAYTPTDGGFTPKTVSIEALLRTRLRDAHATKLKELKKRRIETLTNGLLERLCNHESPLTVLREKDEAFLQDSMAGTTVTMDRSHVPDLLRRFGSRMTTELCEELLFGQWTTTPTIVLKRHMEELRPLIQSLDESMCSKLESSMLTQQCARELAMPNRHGHTEALQAHVIGVVDGVDDYIATRTQNLKDIDRLTAKREDYLRRVRETADFCKTLSSTQLGLVMEHSHLDARQLPAIKALVQ